MKNAKSLIILEVKPYEANLDLDTLAASIKQLEYKGIQNQELNILWHQKLIVTVVVMDELIAVNDIVNNINEKHEHDVQSIDIQAMNKVQILSFIISSSSGRFPNVSLSKALQEISP